MTRLCSISVDLDEVPNYFAIHGLRLPQSARAHSVYDIALDRLGRWADAHQIPLTLFAIGADMARRESALRLRRMIERGHEIANHSQDHLYDLTRRSREEQERQVQNAITVLEGATGARPYGFRAPGYAVTDALFDVLQSSGVSYDSSVFPCPSYYGAKAVAMGAIRLRGRASRSILDQPNVLRAPRRPYRTGRPYWRRGAGMLELPVGVTPTLRLPFIGTAITMAGPDRARWLARRMAREPFVNLELHGIDVLDSTDNLSDLAQHQPDLRVPLRRKYDSLGAVVSVLRSAGYSFVRTDAAARFFA